MKLVFLSDVHNRIARMRIPAGDVLVITGDLTMQGTTKELIKFNADIGMIRKQGGYKEVVVIAGNHDMVAEEDYYMTKSLLGNAIYLEDEPLELYGYKWYGSPWTPYCGEWAFQFHNQDMAMRCWSKIPEDTEILLTHTPPHGTLDTEPHGFRLPSDEGWPNLGDRILRDRLSKLKKLKVHAFGHIHGGHGRQVKNGITFINGASLERDYTTVQTPEVVELEDRDAFTDAT